MTRWLVLVAVAGHLVQSTLVVAAVWLLVVTVLRASESRVRYALWFVASAKFLVPFSILTATGEQLAWLHRMPPALRQRVDVTVDYLSSQVPLPLASSVPPSAIPHAPISLPAWLAAIWFGGAAVIAVRWWMSWREVRLAARASTPLLVSQGVPVRSLPPSFERRWEPGVFGILRPIVLVPDRIRARLTPEQFESVLAHEFCHVERGDNLTAMVHTVVEILFWFHPLAWWLGHRLREERERACDEAVLRRGANPDAYAEGLLRVCRYYVETPVLSVSGITGADLQRRIEAIMIGPAGGTMNAAQRLLLTAFGSALVLVPVLLGMNTSVASAQIGAAFAGLQTAATRAFDVASVKVNTTGDRGWLLGPPQRGTETIRNLELRKIIASSFRIQDKMVLGGPAWLDTARYDITAKGASDASDVAVWEMMRSLLAERFHLKYHLERRAMNVYALAVARGGPRLGDPARGRCGDAIKAGRECGAIRFPPFGVAIDNMPIGALTAVLARRLQDRPVVDNTGLTALYDATVRWMPDEMTPEALAALPNDERPPALSLFDAFEQQVGLTLEERRQAIQVVIVDSIKPADPN
jgi:bla regulator protein blaR1